MFDKVSVSAPSRLHFGLFAFGQSQRRNFGGVGMMLAAPRIRISVSPAENFAVNGDAESRVARAAESWLQFLADTDRSAAETIQERKLRCRIDVEHLPEQHTGLGTGTQLALSIGAALYAAHGLRIPSPEMLARSVGRGLRSAVGTYGFVKGGLVVERGKLESELLSPLDCRLDVPETWRVSLMHPRMGKGLSGQTEANAFSCCPPVDPLVTERLQAEIRDEMLPAVAVADFDRFSESVFRYGQLAGSCFETVQGGVYNGQEVTEIVELTRSMGVAGVGQSSWGPAVFAFHRNELEALEFAARMKRARGDQLGVISHSAPDNSGARITSAARTMSPI